jgi:hypothetical protein
MAARILSPGKMIASIFSTRLPRAEVTSSSRPISHFRKSFYPETLLVLKPLRDLIA